MTKVAKSSDRKSYRTVGETPDGIAVLAPKLKPTKFTDKEIRSAIQAVLEEQSSHLSVVRKGGDHVEVRRKGDGKAATRLRELELSGLRKVRRESRDPKGAARRRGKS